jgi:hypothetical protein
MNDDEKLFQKRLPNFTDTDAALLWSEFGTVVSMDGRPGPLFDTFLVKFVAERTDCGPLVLNQTVARALCGLLIRHGYGPQP